MPRIRLRPAGHLPTPEPALPTPDPELPVGAWPKPEDYPDELEDRFAIARHVVTLSPGDVDEELIEEHYRDTYAVLRWIPMDQLAPGNPNNNRRNRKLEREYAGMPRDTRPPILVENGDIADGNHRYRVAKAAGDAGMWCYDILEDHDD